MTQLEHTASETPLSAPPAFRAIFTRTSWGDRTLFAACQAA